MKKWWMLVASVSLSTLLASPVYALNPGGGSGGGTGGGETGATTGRFNSSMTFDGRNRTYTVHVPRHYTQARSLPLVVDLHGFTSTGSAQQMVSGYHALHDDPEEGFVIVYPQGVSNSWNAGRACCGTASSQNINDVGFIRAMVDSITKKWPKIDKSRIYVTGLSNGSAMTQRLGAEASDLFAAGAGYAMMLLVPGSTNRQPFPYINFHGYDDQVVPYGGRGSFLSVEKNTVTWANLNNCANNPQIEQLSPAGTKEKPNICVQFKQCEGGVEVVSCSINGGHMIYRNPGNINITKKGWDFMKRFSR